MRTVTIGQSAFRISASLQGGRWIARAERAETGDRYGIECAGAGEQEATLRLERWLAWQHEHSAALEALQQAERAYHRTIAGSAFTSPIEGITAFEMQKESLDALEAARARLDEIRAQNPEA